MGNVGNLYIVTCFELIRMNLKSHGKGRNQKTFSIFCIRLTSMQNCKSRIQWIWQILCFHINSIQYSFNIYIKAKTSCGKHDVLIWMDLKSHGKCRNKIIYNFTCFELIRMNLKSHRKNRNQKNFSIFCIKLTSMQNCKSQIQWIWQILYLHINSIQYSFNIYIKAKTSCGKHEVLIWMDLKSHRKCRNKI